MIFRDRKYKAEEIDNAKKDDINKFRIFHVYDEIKKCTPNTLSSQWVITEKRKIKGLKAECLLVLIIVPRVTLDSDARCYAALKRCPSPLRNAGIPPEGCPALVKGAINDNKI